MTGMKKGILISVGFHLILIGVGFLIYYEVTPEQFFRQIEILEFRRERTPAVSEYRPLNRVGEPSVSDFSEGHRSNQTPRRVDLPKVTTELDDPLDKINIPVDRDIATTPVRLDDRIGNTASRVESRISQDALDLSANRLQEQPMTLTGDDYLEALQSLIGEKTDTASAYYLEGEIKQRSILNEVIPEYPEGYEQNATVSIQFNVHPDGQVDDLVVVKKDEPIFEELSLNSLAQWRFNPIPQDIIQKGRITFIYKVE